MLGKSTIRWSVVCLAVLALSLSALLLSPNTRAQSASQTGTSDSVADAARKSREDKKNAPKDKKVYTDDDVAPPAAAPSSAPSGQAPATGDAPAAPAAGEKPADAGKTTASGAAADKNDEKSWRKRFQSQRNQIATAEKELDVLQREEEKAQVQYYPDPQKALSEGYSRKDINEKDAKIAAKKDEIAKLKQGLSDLEDELRQSGGDPGWSRE